MSKKKKDPILTFDTVYWSNVTAKGSLSLINAYEICEPGMAPFLFYSGNSEDVCQIRCANKNFRVASFPFTADEAAVRKKIMVAGGITKFAGKMGLSPTTGPLLVDIERQCVVEQEHFVLDMPNQRSHPLFLSISDIAKELALNVLTIRGDFNSNELFYILTVQSYTSRYIEGPWMSNEVEPFSRDVIGSLVYAHYGMKIPDIKTTGIHAKIRCDTEYDFPQTVDTTRLYDLFHKATNKKVPEIKNILLSELAMVGISEIMKALEEERSFPHTVKIDVQQNLITSVTIRDQKNIFIVAHSKDVSPVTYYRNIWMAPASIKINLRVAKEAN